MKYSEFYDSFSAFYDDMTRYEQRIKNEKDFFSLLKKKYNFKKALDIGCGTGAHTLILSELGVITCGIDPSKGMIEKAKEHTAGKMEMTFINTSLEDYSASENLDYDAAFCMGNSLSHIRGTKELEVFILSLKKALKGTGIFVLQILNYEKILKEKERIVNIREIDDTIFIRFYDFKEKYKLDFNILTISGEKNNRRHNIITTTLNAYTKDILIGTFSLHGFEAIEILGDMKHNAYDADTSPNLIIIFKLNQQI
jgi:SAM-dependent methyltransferase